MTKAITWFYRMVQSYGDTSDDIVTPAQTRARQNVRPVLLADTCLLGTRTQHAGAGAGTAGGDGARVAPVLLPASGAHDQHARQPQHRLHPLYYEGGAVLPALGTPITPIARTHTVVGACRPPLPPYSLFTMHLHPSASSVLRAHTLTYRSSNM